MPFRLPIFPLSVVLFPGTPLPLHIFEPRYRRMLSDVLAADRRFGIVPVLSETDLPVADAIGCVAEVRLNQELPDGRSNIVVLGGPRFRVARVVDDPAPYLMAQIETFEDETGSEPSVEAVDALRQLFGRYLTGVRELNDTPPDADPALPDDAASLSFHVAAAIDCDLRLKQRLLAQRSAASRVRDLCLVLPILTSAVDRGVEVHRRAHSNGGGGKMPDMRPVP